jgi:CheY-like chemotaxis protein
MTTNNYKTILYVDDDVDDREMLSDVIHNVAPALNLVTANNGLEALDYLNASVQKGIDLPCMVVLDLNMPYLNGHETYKRLKGEQSFTAIPVMILTSSRNPNDKKHYDEQGVQFITKPSDLRGLVSVANILAAVCK